MDFIRKYDIELEKEYYYAGEKLRGWVVVENTENLKITGVQVFLRGKAHVEWRITRGGERRTMKEDQYVIDEKLVVWGLETIDDGTVPILQKGDHKFPFEFQLPETTLPCSFESRIGTVRYYLRVIIDIPYASPPQGLKYFTVIGPYAENIDEKYLAPVVAHKQTTTKCLCCTVGPISLESWLERSAYCSGERIKLKCDVQNGSDQDVYLVCRLIQTVSYRITKGSVGLNKEVTHQVLEFHSPPVSSHTTKSFHELYKQLQLPVMPPTLKDACKVIEINYVLRVSLSSEKAIDDVQLDLPLLIVTVPMKNSPGSVADLSYEPADDHVEGGIYISPEFQLGQVYDGAADVGEDIILYRPVYVCVDSQGRDVVSNGHSPSLRKASSESLPQEGAAEEADLRAANEKPETEKKHGAASCAHPESERPHTKVGQQKVKSRCSELAHVHGKQTNIIVSAKPVVHGCSPTLQTCKVDSFDRSDDYGRQKIKGYSYSHERRAASFEHQDERHRDGHVTANKRLAVATKDKDSSADHKDADDTKPLMETELPLTMDEVANGTDQSADFERLPANTVDMEQTQNEGQASSLIDDAANTTVLSQTKCSSLSSHSSS